MLQHLLYFIFYAITGFKAMYNCIKFIFHKYIKCHIINSFNIICIKGFQLIIFDLITIDKCGHIIRKPILANNPTLFKQVTIIAPVIYIYATMIDRNKRRNSISSRW